MVCGHAFPFIKVHLASKCWRVRRRRRLGVHRKLKGVKEMKVEHRALTDIKSGPEVWKTFEVRSVRKADIICYKWILKMVWRHAFPFIKVYLASKCWQVRRRRRLGVHRKLKVVKEMKTVCKFLPLTPPIAEILRVKNGRAIVVCGFLMKYLKKHILKFEKNRGSRLEVACYIT